MKHFNFIILGLAVSLMLGSCNSSPNPKDGNAIEAEGTNKKMFLTKLLYLKEALTF